MLCLCFCSAASSAASVLPNFEVPVRLIGGRLDGITLWVNSFEHLVSKSISAFNFAGHIRYLDSFVPLQRPVGFFFHFPTDSEMKRVFVTCDQELGQFVDVHGIQPLLLYRGSTPPDHPTPPSSPPHAKAASAPRSSPPHAKAASASSSISVSVDKATRFYVHERDGYRCCFTGETETKTCFALQVLTALELSSDINVLLVFRCCILSQKRGVKSFLPNFGKYSLPLQMPETCSWAHLK